MHLLLKPSRIAMISCLVLHLVAVAGLLTAGLQIAVMSTLLFGILCSAVYCMKAAQLRTAASIAGVAADDDGYVLELCGGRRIPARIRHAYCLSWLQLVRFTRTGKLRAGNRPHNFTMLVLPDSAGHAQRRQLRAWLRTAVAAPTTTTTTTTTRTTKPSTV